MRTMESDKAYEILEKEFEKFDALYEDYIIHLLGEDGFMLLRKEKRLTTCGSVNGRNLYTLNE